MENPSILCLITLVVLCLTAGVAEPHFQVLIPSADVIGPGDDDTLDLKILFTHPMEQGPVMEMGRPRRFGVLVSGKRHDLSGTLKARKIDGKAAYACPVRVREPGDYVFYIEPAPYWEAAEGKMIVHYTKVVVDVLGAEEGWDAMVGFPVEIEPLVRPFGLWAGNTFRGIVRKGGKPVPFATVEIEYFNEGSRVKIPNDALITQVIKADASGVFSYTMPRAGWWGFAALVDGDKKMNSPGGETADVELGGLIWIKTVEMETE